MTFKEIYDRIISLWGDIITFSDGAIITPEKRFRNIKREIDGSNYFFSKTVSDLWNSVEEGVQNKNPYDELMVYTLYQIFHRHAYVRFTKGIYHFSPATISSKEVEAQYYKNLCEVGWEDELAGYNRLEFEDL